MIHCPAPVLLSQFLRKYRNIREAGLYMLQPTFRDGFSRQRKMNNDRVRRRYSCDIRRCEDESGHFASFGCESGEVFLKGLRKYTETFSGGWFLRLRERELLLASSARCVFWDTGCRLRHGSLLPWSSRDLRNKKHPVGHSMCWRARFPQYHLQSTY